MRTKICVRSVIIMLLLLFGLTTTFAAASERTIIDESIYDVLIDRFFNGTTENDVNVDSTDPNAFNGGDFVGLTEKADFIKRLGFTIVSIGNVFPTETYDGSFVTSYEGLEPHFGTAQELTQLIHTYEAKQIGVMVDFPLTNVSAQHEWVKAYPQWVESEEDGRVQWDFENTAFQQELQNKVIELVEQYNVQAIRLTHVEQVDTTFLNKLIEELKKERDLYVLAAEESDAHFDAVVVKDLPQLYADSYKNVDLNSGQLVETILQQSAIQLQFDTLQTDRFTKAVMSETGNHFPPNRLPLVIAHSLLMPGVPVITYGSEIAMNGSQGAEAHQLYNFKTGDDLITAIENLQTLRNASETLRSGELEIIKNEGGYLAFTRISKDEKWLIVINNTSETQRINVSELQIGTDQVITGLFESDAIRQNKDGAYPVILEREKFEVYQIQKDKGLNKSYMIALGLVYVLFTLFIVLIIKRSRKKRA